METHINRIEQEIDQWKAKEQRQAKLFSPAVIRSRAFQHEKLAHYGRLAVKYRRPQNADERLSWKLLRQEKRKIERELYPNRLVRLARRAVLLLARQIVKAIDARRIARNEKQLQGKLADIGFGDQVQGLRQMMGQRRDEFKIPASWHVTEKERMDFEVTFKKQKNGTYKLDGYKAALNHEDSPAGKPQHTFNPGGNGPVTAEQAANLLAGRAVKTEDKWLSLDLNDKDANGNFRSRQFHPGYGYDLEKALKQLPLKELKNQQTRHQLLDNLENGQRQQVTMKMNGKGRKIFVEANPQFKTVNVFNENGSKISVAQALGKQLSLEPKQGRQVSQAIKPAKRNGVSVGG